MLYSILPNFKFEKAAGVDWSELEKSNRSVFADISTTKDSTIIN